MIPEKSATPGRPCAAGTRRTGALRPLPRAAPRWPVVVLPATMALLVGTIGLFTLHTSMRDHLIYGLFGPGLSRSTAELRAQIVLISFLTAALGLGLVLRARAPFQALTGRLEALRARARRGGKACPGGPEGDSLAGAFNDAIGALNRYIFDSMTGAVAAPDADRCGTPAGAGPAVAEVDDLSEIRAFRDRLRRADELATLGTLTAGVAHELRNPLASLQGLAELLGRDFPSDDPRHGYVATMIRAIERLNRLVEDVLFLSAPGSPSAETFDLVETVRETVLMAQLGLGDRAVRLEVPAAAGPLAVTGSHARLAQALTNLVLNAVQATPDGGVVTVAASRSGGEAVVRVHNTGSYIPPEQLAQVSVPFFTTKARGTGLGLAIARQIVNAHGGRLEVESARDEGTTFSIRLPAAEAGHGAGKA